MIATPGSKLRGYIGPVDSDRTIGADHGKEELERIFRSPRHFEFLFIVRMGVFFSFYWIMVSGLEVGRTEETGYEK